MDPVKALSFPGVMDHLPAAVVILVLGGVLVKLIVRTWRAFLDTIQEIVAAALATHTSEEKMWRDADATQRAAAQREQAEWRLRLEDEITELRGDVRKVHERIDQLLKDLFNGRGH